MGREAGMRPKNRSGGEYGTERRSGSTRIRRRFPIRSGPAYNRDFPSPAPMTGK